MKTLQKFASVHASLYNHFNLEHHLFDLQTKRNAARPHWLSGRSLC
jgi:putative transposase